MKNQPVIFLDVDGVLNRCGKSHLKLEVDLLNNFQRITDEIDPIIVLSSSWRKFERALKDLLFEFTNRGLVILSHTPILDCKIESGIYTSVERGVEIQQWMDENWTPYKFVIIDDGSDMAHLKTNLIQTNSFEGLTPEITNQIINFLK